MSFEDIQQYLLEAQNAIRMDRYQIAMNANREDNMKLFEKYVIDEAAAKEILLSLTPDDFSEVLQNKHPGREYEQLYVFGKKVVLLERFGTAEKRVALYIKMNKINKQCVIIISFHEQKHPLKYYFT